MSSIVVYNSQMDRPRNSDPVKTQPIPLPRVSTGGTTKKKKGKREERNGGKRRSNCSRRDLARGGILSRAAYDQDYLRGNLCIQ
ncbi:hypothetical protein K0M31_001683 [Melipona bicolor]|uniref:Uncharacterized protein n=1 Tax=Melipona bicolor TaxID=60889 RepID=A0AA40GGB6_9HYME|nr:hypothetical protein K0M31_001683 [Melipona bicolor]